MKGVVFTEFLNFVGEQFSQQLVDEIIEESDLPSDGAYTAVGTYDHHEMTQLVSALSSSSGIPSADLVISFGQHLFGIFAKKYPMFLEGMDSTFQFLLSVEETIHVEVRKLYPDAELPAFEYESPDPNRMVLIYHSSRALGDLAQGLVTGCIEYFGDPITIERENLPPGDGTNVRFLLTREE
ncbi:MAG: hypothetical protein GY731_09930 [Gammaproteobacteria bacterium]|nr:hypothetical protein [Gammaproteobacteria bacterium]